VTIRGEPSLAPWPGEPESMLVTAETGDRLHYLDWGTGAATLPPLLVIHGLGATAWSWAPVARRLRDVTHVLAPDLRGHGLSDSPRNGYDLTDLAFDALTVLSANGYGAGVGGRRAVIAGHGLGALVAATLAVEVPASVAAVALVDAGWEAFEEATAQTAAEFVRSIGDPPEVMASMSHYLADRREYDPASWDADQERAARSAVDEKHAGHVAPVLRPHALRATVEAMFGYDPRAVITRIDAPLLMVVAESGAADDVQARERRLALDDLIVARTGDGRPPPEVRIFSSTGHNLMRYRPQQLSAALIELLEVAHQR
jgi:pimeloyl-ACP methyl ester carboxylesterase